MIFSPAGYTVATIKVPSPTPSKSEMSSAVRFTVKRSVIPSPLKSAMAMSVGSHWLNKK